EEVWSWWQDGSVHLASWPEAAELPAGGDPALLEVTAEALRQVRKAKSQAKVSMRAEVARAVVRGPGTATVRAAAEDLRAAGNVAELELDETAAAEELTVAVTLAAAV